MSLNGCDVASYQWDVAPSKMTTTDFMIVKATQGTWYVNPYFEKQYREAKAAGKLLGIYHYIEGTGVVKEAAFFVKTVGNRIGECILGADHEGKSNPIFNTSSEVNYIYDFCEEVYRLTKVRPLIYVSKSVTRRRDWSKVSTRCKLWCAQYGSNNVTNYQTNPWTDSNGFGSWEKDTIRQYSSHGRIRGYSKNIDINLAYLSKEEWMALARGDRNKETPVMAAKTQTKWSDYIYKTTSPVKISNSGSDEHGNYKNGQAGDQTGKEWYIRDWYNRPWNCVLRHPLAEVRACLATLAVKAAQNDNIGYDQNQRDSYGNALKDADYDPSRITKKVESDCSKGVIDNARATGYILGIEELKKLDATYTGNMRAGFSKAGFQVLTASRFLTSGDYLLAGDILLNDAHHTCTVVTNGSKSGNEAAQTVSVTMEEWEMLPTLKRTSKGKAVEHLQWMLNRASYKNKKKIDEDGSFGWDTTGRVVDFQNANGLEPDGIVGPKTWKKIYDNVF